MMPVKVAEDEAPARRGVRKKSVIPPARRGKDGSIEIEFPRWQRIRVYGEVDATALGKVIELLSK